MTRRSKEPKLPKLSKWESPEAWPTDAICLALMSATDDDMLAGLVSVLRFPDRRPRRSWAPALPAFLKLLGHPNAHVRAYTADTAAKAGVLEALPKIAELLADRRQPAHVRDTCAFALACMPDERYLELVLGCLAE